MSWNRARAGRWFGDERFTGGRKDYKISNPTISGSMDNGELTRLYTGYGWDVRIVEGDDLDTAMADAMD